METGAFDHDPVPDFDDVVLATTARRSTRLDENVGRVLKTLEPVEEDTRLALYGGQWLRPRRTRVL